MVIPVCLVFIYSLSVSSLGVVVATQLLSCPGEQGILPLLSLPVSTLNSLHSAALGYVHSPLVDHHGDTIIMRWMAQLLSISWNVVSKAPITFRPTAV
jgi:hypothetical protein